MCCYLVARGTGTSNTFDCVSFDFSAFVSDDASG